MREATAGRSTAVLRAVRTARWLFLGLLLASWAPLLGCGGGCREDSGDLVGGAGDTDPDPDPDIDFVLRTQTQGGWGQGCAGNNPGCYRDANFASCFPQGLVIGCGSGFELTFTTAGAIQAFLPQGGPPGPLTSSATDPLSSAAGVLAGQLLAAKLNVGFDLCDPAFGQDATHLVDLQYIDGGPCDGMTVGQVIALADQLIGGCLTEAQAGLTYAQAAQCLDTLNNNFVDGTSNHGNLGLP